METILQTTMEMMMMGPAMAMNIMHHPGAVDGHRRSQLLLPNEVDEAVEVLLQSLVIMKSPAQSPNQVIRAKLVTEVRDKGMMLFRMDESSQPLSPK